MLWRFIRFDTKQHTQKFDKTMKVEKKLNYQNPAI